MSDLGIEELPPGRYAGMVEKVRYTFTATTRIFITYRLDTPDGIRRLEETFLIGAPPSSASHFQTTHGLARVEDILRISGMTLADAEPGGLKSLPGLLEGVALSVVTRNQRLHGLQLPDRGARGETVTRQKKPYEFAEDADPFVVIGIDAEWVYRERGEKPDSVVSVRLLNADSGKR